MISTDERSPSGGDGIENSVRRLSTLHPHHNNNDGENSLYYDNEYNPRALDSDTGSVIHTEVNRSPSPPSSPLLHRQINHSQIVLRDPPSQLDNLQESRRVVTTSASTLPRSLSTSGLADFILSSRLIPKLGSLVKRFSLNYSGEGLVTDRQRTRTVRVGIRFQVQLDSFEQERPRAILRSQSAPVVEQLDSGLSSPTENNTQASRYNSNTSVTEHCCGEGSSYPSLEVGSSGIIIGGDSSGVSSEATSPTLNRRESSPSTTLAFHNRINQALHSYRRSQLGSSPPSTGGDNVPFSKRRSSVPVCRWESSTPPKGPDSLSDQEQQHTSGRMEDSSSYQVLRHFPGSNVHSLNELNWETAAFEKEIRERLKWIGDKVSCIRVPRFISQLMDFGKEYARENPVTALILLALCLASSAPVLMFFVFAVATILVTFLGFLFVEGTLLTVATVIFGGVILVVGFLTLTAILIGMLGYFTTNQAYLVLTGKSKIFRLLRKLPLIGRLYSEQHQDIKEKKRTSIREEDEHISKLLNGIVSNGNVTNGYGPHHHDQDDFDDLLDSEVEEEEETIPTVVSDSELELETTSEDGDLGNQEIAPGAHNADKEVVTEVIAMNGTTSSASSTVETEDENGSSASPSSPHYMNGGHYDEMNRDGLKNVEVDSQNSD